MKILLPTVALLALPLMSMPLSGCSSHERLHHNLRGLHEDFHDRSHTRAEHEQFHDDLDALHDDAHEQGLYRRRY